MKTSLIIAFIVFSVSALGQDTIEIAHPIKGKTNGYLKSMQSVNFTDKDNFLVYNLLHNRFNINLEYKQIQFSVGMRNRFFYGDQVKYTPKMDSLLDIDNGFVDMSFVWAKSPALIAHSTFDRLNFSWTTKKMELTIGRQRINWGMNLAWNPNDLFNTYNFIDFDYEERPGNDAIRFQYYFKGGMDVLDVAVKPGKTSKESIIAGRYRFNTKGYDIQTLGGWYNGDLAAGIGWAGNIWNLGFKGEGTYFHPTDQSFDTMDVLSASVSLDYSFKKGIFLNFSGLFNSSGIEDISQLGLLQTSSSFGDINAKRLMPTIWSTLLQGSYPVTPLLNTSLAVIYGSNINLLIVFPTISYSVASNWDLALIGQLFFIEINNQFQTAGNSIFARIKWSF